MNIYEVEVYYSEWIGLYRHFTSFIKAKNFVKRCRFGRGFRIIKHVPNRNIPYIVYKKDKKR